MKKNKAHVGRLALKKETIRKLGDRPLNAVSAGYECSVTGSGKVMCNALTGEHAMATKIASS